ncbi:unnamed protein product [Lota lota]
MTSSGSSLVHCNGARVAHLPGQYGEVSQTDRPSELQTDLEHHLLFGTRNVPIVNWKKIKMKQKNMNNTKMIMLDDSSFNPGQCLFFTYLFWFVELYFIC